MKILFLHNYYQQRGGEDQCFEEQADAMEERDHTVTRYVVHNKDISPSWVSKIKTAKDTVWNRNAFREVQSVIRDVRPDVMHAVNTFPLLSPSVFYAAKAMGVPVVHEIANYRIACANALLLRNNHVCTKCLDNTLPWGAIVHRCYRGSTMGSAVVASNILLHRIWKTWDRGVDAVVCPSHVCKEKLILGGVSRKKIHVNENALRSDPGVQGSPDGSAIFVGRLCEEKGVRTVVEAWRRFPDLPRLKIVGDGPIRDIVQKLAAEDQRIEFVGWLSHAALLEMVGRSDCLLMPSICIEPFGRTTIEAFAVGTPVLGSRIGGTVEIINDGVDGYFFEPGDAADLAMKVRRFFGLSCEERERMRLAARRSFESRYTSDRHCDRLLDIYNKVIADNRSR
jgi:glycosyltransferase involved in cell wall biosynthesis